MKFAEGTVVAPEKSRMEIETVVRRYGATEFSSGFSGLIAAVQFQASGRRVRFSLTLPDTEWAKDQLINAKRPRYYNRKYIPDAVCLPLVAAEERRRWRCLLLAIKAKLEIVQSEIATFEEEFLAHIVREDGKTVYETIMAMAESGQRLLPAVES